MLRASGRSGKLTDNYDACRDLQGRRIRHQEADKRLAEWAAEEKQRELERVAQAHIKKQAKEERQREIERVCPSPPPSLASTALRAEPRPSLVGLVLPGCYCS